MSSGVRFHGYLKLCKRLESLACAFARKPWLKTRNSTAIAQKFVFPSPYLLHSSHLIHLSSTFVYSSMLEAWTGNLIQAWMSILWLVFKYL